MNQTQVSEEEKDTARYEELKGKQDKTEQENKEFGEIKERYAGRAEKRIAQLTAKAKAEEEKRLEAEKRAEEAEAKAKEREEQPPIVVGNENETEEHGGKQWYSDAALSAQIRSGKITEDAAIKYQSERNETKIVVRVKDDLRKEQEQRVNQQTRVADAKSVLKDHPEFSDKHPDHNPNDPLYKMTIELYNDGLGTRPDGFSKALTRAKQILGVKTPIDRSGDLGVEGNAAPQDKGGKEEKEVPWTDGESEVAVNMYTTGEFLNPKTGRAYTRDEAIAKGKEAKRRRMR